MLVSYFQAKLAAAMVYTKVGKKLGSFLKSVGDTLQVWPLTQFYEVCYL